jgi:hypothetical protein
VLADVGLRANEEYARDICENSRHMVPIDEVVASAWKQAPELFKLPRPYQLV